MQTKITLKENCVVSKFQVSSDVVSRDNANTFCRFILNLSDLLLQTPPCPKNKFGIKTTEEHYKQIQNECEDLNLHNVRNVDVTTVNTISTNLDVVKSSGIDKISATFLKDGAPVIAIHLANIINLR